MSENEHVGAARRFIETMAPLRGEPVVAAAVLHVMAANDPDAKAVEMTQRLVEQMKPVVAAFNRFADALAASFGPDWAQRVNEIMGAESEDAAPFDDTPEDCWRCDAVAATTDVGLCDSCWDDLVKSARDSSSTTERKEP